MCLIINFIALLINEYLLRNPNKSKFVIYRKISNKM